MKEPTARCSTNRPSGVRRGAWRRAASGILSVVSLLSLAAPGMLRATTAAEAPRPRLVVKYRSSVDACVHCLVAHGVPFRTLTGTSSLDALTHDLGVSRARPVFFKDHTVGRGRSGAWMATVDRARRQFSKRTRRAPFGAEVPDLSRVYV